MAETNPNSFKEIDRQVRQIQVTPYKGEKLQPPKNYWEYLKLESPIIKFTQEKFQKLTKQETDSKTNPEARFKELEQQIKQVTETADQIFGILRDVDWGGDNLKKLVESIEGENKLFFLKDLDKKLTQDLFRVAKNLTVEDRKKLTDIIKGVKAYEELKKTVQNIGRQLIKNIDLLILELEKLKPETETHIKTSGYYKGKEVIRMKRGFYDSEATLDNRSYKLSEIGYKHISQLQAYKLGIQLGLNIDADRLSFEDLPAEFVKEDIYQGSKVDTYKIPKSLGNVYIATLWLKGQYTPLNDVYSIIKEEFHYSFDEEKFLGDKNTFLPDLKNYLKNKLEISMYKMHGISPFNKLLDRPIEDFSENTNTREMVSQIIDFLKVFLLDKEGNFLMDMDFLNLNKENVYKSLISSLSDASYINSKNNFIWASSQLDKILPGFTKEFIKTKNEQIQNAFLKNYENGEYESNNILVGFFKTNFSEFKLNPENTFIKKLIDQHSKQAKPLIDGYFECKKSENPKLELDDQAREAILEFIQKFRVIGPNIIADYLWAKKENKEAIYIARIKELTDKIGSKGLSKEEQNLPYYSELIKYVYSNNVGRRTTYESNASCEDRNLDLENFKIEEKYKVETSDASQVSLKEGLEINPKLLEELQKPVYEILKTNKNITQGEIKTSLNEKVDVLLKELINNNSEAKGEYLENLELDKLPKLEEKLFVLMQYSLLNEKSGIEKQIQEFLILYHFSKFQNLQEYITGTNDKVSYAKNKDYALLLELNEFYDDSLKEVKRFIIEESSQNPEIKKLLAKNFQTYHHQSNSQKKQEQINKLQIDKLGLSEGFVNQIQQKLIERKLGKKPKKEELEKFKKHYSKERIVSIITRYETIAKGLQAKNSNSKNKNTQAIYSMLKSQRDKTFSAHKLISAEELNILSTHLGEINLQKYLNIQASVASGTYDEEEFLSFLAQKSIDLYSREQNLVKIELDKFEIKKTTKEESYSSVKISKGVNGFFSKSKESANARMVGGVCVSGDNPDKNKENNLWDMPNYFQLVLQDPDSLRCQGLVLLHHFKDENGKKILTASFNPSSTFLYSVSEEDLFKGLLATLEKFAKDNQFDLICVSNNKNIRTNRTGGEFEKTIDKKIREVNQTYKFSEPKVFSFAPNYQIQEMDLVWANSN